MSYVLYKILNSRVLPLDIIKLPELCVYISEILISRTTVIRHYYITILYPRVLQYEATIMYLSNSVHTVIM